MTHSSSDVSEVVSSVEEELPIPHRATTSRALLDNDLVRVVAFAFDTGERLTEHTAAGPVVVHLIEGRLRFEVDGAEHALAAGDCVYLAPGAPHALEALEPARIALVLLHDAT